MRALSVRQPWASLIAARRKTIELRSWSTDYRGPLLILAGSGLWRGEHDWPTDGPRGVALCRVELVDVRPVRRGDASRACIEPPPGFDFAWVLEGAEPVERVPVKGRLGLYRPDAALLRAVGLQ